MIAVYRVKSLAVMYVYICTQLIVDEIRVCNCVSAHI